MNQSRFMSFIESTVNILVGLAINMTAQYFIFPLFGIHIPMWKNAGIAFIFTFISLLRSYIIRRWFNKII
jgi:hypothetical protein